MPIHPPPPPTGVGAGDGRDPTPVEQAPCNLLVADGVLVPQQGGFPFEAGTRFGDAALGMAGIFAQLELNTLKQRMPDGKKRVLQDVQVHEPVYRNMPAIVTRRPFSPLAKPRQPANSSAERIGVESTTTGCVDS